MADRIIFIAKHGVPILLGSQADQNALTVKFDVTKWTEYFGSGVTFELTHIREGDVSRYPCVTELEDGYLNWNVGVQDVANPGVGNCELVVLKSGMILHTDRWITKVRPHEDMLPDPPEPQEAWVNKVLAAAEKVGDVYEKFNELTENKLVARTAYVDGEILVLEPLIIE